MFNKIIKIKVPKECKCKNCGKMAKIEFARLTLDYVLVAEYMCGCKRTIVRTKSIDFI
ncbi:MULTISPECIES: hypothetical protein [unclassified Clostridium]|uniref:hypothetical protein n=1 Tax=unclassified Clostridium TaxID=2614128 RepID=UPI00029811BA|nr:MULTISPECIES: hypothetical protein [unclassified Clostridium]EKQ56298.1 MAG: hypothetical protein A370_02054 [Clostridium sp. Maddingley MBC34-26]